MLICKSPGDNETSHGNFRHNHIILHHFRKKDGYSKNTIVNLNYFYKIKESFSYVSI